MSDVSTPGVKSEPHPGAGPARAGRWSRRVRQTHRWLSIAFVTGVIMATIATASAGEQEPSGWFYVLPGGSLVLLALTGLYLFALPHLGRWRATKAAQRGGNR